MKRRTFDMIGNGFNYNGSFFYLLADGEASIKYGITENSLIARIKDAKSRFNENLTPKLILSFSEDGEAYEFEKCVKMGLPWGCFFSSEYIHIKGNDEGDWKYGSLIHHVVDTIISAYGATTDDARVEYMDLGRGAEMYFAYSAGQYKIQDRYFEKWRRNG